MKVKVNDTVLIISGKYKNKTGKVLKVFNKSNKITVEKINIVTKHIKKTANRHGEKIQFEAPFSASNAKVICPHCDKAVKIGYSIPADGKKYRHCKKCQKNVDINLVAKKTTKTKKH